MDLTPEERYTKRLELEKPVLDALLVWANEASAVIYSLIETAKENDLDPYRYLVWLLNHAPGLSRTDEVWAESFLPVNAPRNARFLNHNENADRHLIAYALRWRPFYTHGGLTVTRIRNCSSVR